jgi:hypothetical protein
VVPIPDQERRKYERYETDVKVQFYVTFDLETKIHFKVKEKDKGAFSPEKYSAVSKNISVEGICFMTEKRLSKGDLLALEVYVPSSTHAIHMQGEVRWCVQEKGKRDVYETGVKILTVEGERVEKTIVFDEVHNIMWSAVLDLVFSSFKQLSLKRKQGLSR